MTEDETVDTGPISDEAVADSKDTRLRKLMAALVVAMALLLATAVVTVVIALNQREEDAQRGATLAEQVKDVCDDPKVDTSELGYLCRNADKVIAGAQGDQGVPGPQGSQGLEGPPGPAGPPGPQGNQGNPGPEGQEGVQGNAGTDGANGTDGEPGANGADGEPGPQGPPGEKGEKGDPGERGEQGLAGVVDVAMDGCEERDGFYIDSVRLAYNQETKTITVVCTQASDGLVGIPGSN